jgi:hypothetical protein
MADSLEFTLSWAGRKSSYPPEFGPLHARTKMPLTTIEELSEGGRARLREKLTRSQSASSLKVGRVAAPGT